MGFSLINQPFGGYPHDYGNHHISPVYVNLYIYPIYPGLATPCGACDICGFLRRGERGPPGAEPKGRSGWIWVNWGDGIDVIMVSDME